jgi:hypothetical protein
MKHTYPCPLNGEDVTSKCNTIACAGYKFNPDLTGPKDVFLHEIAQHKQAIEELEAKAKRLDVHCICRTCNHWAWNGLDLTGYCHSDDFEEAVTPCGYVDGDGFMTRADFACTYWEAKE